MLIRRWWIFGLFMLLPLVAHAQAIADVDKLITRFRTVSATWTGPLTGLAVASFGILAVIDLAYHLGYRAILMKGGEPADFVAVVAQRVVTLSFFSYLLLQFTTIGPLIISSLGFAAKQAGGVGMRPQDIMAAGASIAGKIGDKVSIFHPGDSLTLFLLGTIVMLCFVWITASMVYVLIESYFIIGAGQILLLFGGSSFTSDIPQNLLRTVLGIALKLYALQLIASVGTQFIDEWVNEIHDITFVGILIDIGQVFLLAAVTSRVPSMFERLVSHVQSGGAGDIVRAGATIAAAATVMSRAAASMTSAAAGVGNATTSAAQLAALQNPSGAGGSMARAASIVASAGNNLAYAAGQDLRAGLTGQRSSLGSAPWRMSNSMNEQRRVMQENATRPRPGGNP